MRRDQFGLLWAGHTASQLGIRVGQIAVPLLAVGTLAATPFDMGVLAAAQSIGVVVVGIPAGALVDRLRRRRLMVTASLVRAGALMSVPTLGMLGGLGFDALVLVALCLGVAGALFDIGQQAYLPTLVDRDGLVRANARLQGGQSVSASVSPGLGGALVDVAGAVAAVALTGLAFLGSALALVHIHGPDPKPAPGDRSFVKDIGAGLRHVWTDAALRAIAECTATANLFMSMLTSLTVLFLVRDVGLAPAAVGLIGGAAGVGGLAAALTARRWTERFGSRRAMWLCLLATQPFAVLLPTARPDGRLALFVLGWLTVVYGVTVYNIVQVSHRQADCPPHLLGRVQAANRVLTWSTAPIGNLLGGGLATALGPRATMLVAGAGLTASVVWLLASPLSRTASEPVTPAARR